MVDTSLTGMRCRATREIRSHQGLVRRYREGIRLSSDVQPLRLNAQEQKDPHRLTCLLSALSILC
jgi:hypothetical protein